MKEIKENKDKMKSETLNTLIEGNRGNIIVETPMDSNLEVFHRNGQGLYAWMYREQFDSNSESVKFGQYGTNAENGSTPQNTIRGYTGTTADSIVILWAVRFTEHQIDTIGTAYDVEQQVGKEIGQQSNLGSSTEVFLTDVDTIKETVNSILYPSASKESAQKATYSPRLRQQDAIDSFITYINTDQEKYNFLLGAVMRFGKNFTFLEMARKVVGSNGNILMITGRPDVFPSLKSDIANHINYDGWIYDELKESTYDWKPSNDTVNVLAVSAQLLKHDNHRRKLANYISKFDWTIRGIDEADTAMLSELSTKLLNKLSAKYTVWITGTPWRVQSTGKFKDENTYVYDYLKQQQDKKAGIDPRAISLDWYCLNVSDRIANDQVWYTDDEGFTLTKLFSYNKETKRFIHEGHVRLFLEMILGKIPKTKFSPYLIASDIKHTVWALPTNTDMILHLKSMIEEVAPEYKVFAATGNEKDSVDDITEVKDFLRWNPEQPTIVLTINRFTRGTTVSEWDAVFFMSDTEAAEHYFQTCFRPTSPAEGKDRGYVFDFNPNRTLIMTAEYARLAAKERKITDPSEITREFLDNFSIFSVEEGEAVEFKKWGVDDVLEAIRNSDYNADTLRNTVSEYINTEFGTLESRLSDKSKSEILGIPLSKVGKLELSVASSELSPKGKNYKQSNNKTEKKARSEEVRLMKKIASMMCRLTALSMFGTGFNTVENILTNTDDDLFYATTQANKEILQMLVDDNLIDTYIINLQLA